MALLRLPPETLTQIFDQIGSAFFRYDLDRLTVSKRWSEFALPACFKCFVLSEDTLQSLTASVAIRTASSLQGGLESLHFELRGYQPVASTSHLLESGQRSNSLNTIAPQEVNSDNPVEYWRKTLDNDLAQLAIIAQRSYKLRTLRIRAWNSVSSEDYLSLPTMQALLSLDNLSVLVLDLSTNILDSPESHGTDQHICPAIGAILHTLQTLQLRMCSICPNVLKPRDPNDRLRLNAVVINLSLTANPPKVISPGYSKRCGSNGSSLPQLQTDIQEQAEALATQMATPKLIRILTHWLPGFQTQSLDVLTGKAMVLGDDVAWDEDGIPVDEYSDSDSEFFDICRIPALPE